MLSVIWELAHCLDLARIDASLDETVELVIPTQQLRGPDARSDNINLKRWLDRLIGIKLQGEYRGDPWAAVMVAQYEFKGGGGSVRIIIPPAAVKALRSSETFAKIETAAAHQLPGHARRLYALLADKKRLKNPEWIFELDELRALMGVADKKTYARWDSFRSWVLTPAVAGINDYGTVRVTMEPVKRGRAVHAVKFSWAWKSLDDARITTEENERHSVARRKGPPQNPDAPPLVKDVEIGEIKTLLADVANKLRAESEEVVLAKKFHADDPDTVNQLTGNNTIQVNGD